LIPTQSTQANGALMNKASPAYATESSTLGPCINVLHPRTAPKNPQLTKRTPKATSSHNYSVNSFHTDIVKYI
jgi:hypothetical protein